MKKNLFSGAVVAGMFVAQLAQAPTIPIPLPKERPKLEFRLPYEPMQRQLEEWDRYVKNHERERHLARSDPIYSIIYDYFQERTTIPSYITKEYVRAFPRVEATDYARAVGKAGERGLMQHMKGTWYALTKENFEINAFNPKKSIENGIRLILDINRVCEKKNKEWDKLSDEEKRAQISAAYNGGTPRLMHENFDVNGMEESTILYTKKIEKWCNYFMRL